MKKFLAKFLVLALTVPLLWGGFFSIPVQAVSDGYHIEYCNPGCLTRGGTESHSIVDKWDYRGEVCAVCHQNYDNWTHSWGWYCNGSWNETAFQFVLKPNPSVGCSGFTGELYGNQTSGTVSCNNHIERYCPGHEYVNVYNVVYNANGATSGSASSQSCEVWKTYNFSTGGTLAKTGYVLKGWATTPGGDVVYKLGDSFTNLTKSHGATINLYAVWKECYQLNINNNKPAKASRTVTNSTETNRKWFEVDVDRLNACGALPSPQLRGWTFLGWKMDGTTVDNSTLWTWKQNKTIVAQWRENKYNVTYNDGAGNTYTDKNIAYEDLRKVLTATETGFEKPGYYLDGWVTKEGQTNPVYKVPVDLKIDPGRSSTPDSFSRLVDEDGGNINLYAVWKAAPFVLRIYDNYNRSTTLCTNNELHNTCSYHKDYMTSADTPFILPDALWNHGSAILLGYDIDASVIKPSLKVKGVVNPKNMKPFQVYNVFCVWNNAPTIQAPVEVNFDYATAAAKSIPVDNGTVSSTDLEAWLLQSVTAHDYEWELGHTGAIPPGITDGYTLKIESFTPNLIKDSAGNEVPLSYTVTFIVVDDAGSSASAVTKLFLGDSLNILLKTY